MHDLAGGGAHLVHEVAQLGHRRRHLGRHVLPGRARRDCRPRPSASVSVNTRFPPCCSAWTSSSSSSWGQRRIDAAGADPPGAAGAVVQLAHDLVAMHRLLGQQGEDGCADIAAPGPAARRSHPAHRLAEAELVPAAVRAHRASTRAARRAGCQWDDDVIGHVRTSFRCACGRCITIYRDRQATDRANYASAGSSEQLEMRASGIASGVVTESLAGFDERLRSARAGRGDMTSRVWRPNRCCSAALPSGFAVAVAGSHDDAGFADKMGSMPKYVFSNSLESADRNNRPRSGALRQPSIAALKQEPSVDLLVVGHAALLSNPRSFTTGRRVPADGVPGRPWNRQEAVRRWRHEPLRLIETKPAGEVVILRLEPEPDRPGPRRRLEPVTVLRHFRDRLELVKLVEDDRATIFPGGGDEAHTRSRGTGCRAGR